MAGQAACCLRVSEWMARFTRDGATNVRVSAAVDALGESVRSARSGTALSFLATPTDIFAVPGDAVDASSESYARRRTSKVLRVPLRTLSGGRDTSTASAFEALAVEWPA